jgi:hypothetical protein
MKTFVLSLFLLAIAIPSFAGTASGVAFQLYSGTSGQISTTAAYDVRKFSTKTMTVSGATVASTASSITFKNMSGTAIAQCAPTSSGPWSTCVANDYAQTAVSKTTDGTFTWRDAAAYIRLKWTSGTVKTKLKAYLNWLE